MVSTQMIERVSRQDSFPLFAVWKLHNFHVSVSYYDLYFTVSAPGWKERCEERRASSELPRRCFQVWIHRNDVNHKCKIKDYKNNWKFRWQKYKIDLPFIFSLWLFSLSIQHFHYILDGNVESGTILLKAFPSIRSLEDKIRQEIKLNGSLENSCKQWFLRKVI